MCDFHSIAIRIDGAIAHVPENSHAQAVEAAGWVENTDFRTRFWEWEWDGRGQIPPVEKLLRGEGYLEKVVKLALRHARNLQRALNEPGWGLFDRGYFSEVRYVDVRYEVAKNPNCPAHVLEKLSECFNWVVRLAVAKKSQLSYFSFGKIGK